MTVVKFKSVVPNDLAVVWVPENLKLREMDKERKLQIITSRWKSTKLPRAMISRSLSKLMFIPWLTSALDSAHSAG